MIKIRPQNFNINLILIFVLVFLASCARQSNPDIGRGSTYQFVEGYPELRFSTVGFINEQGIPTLNITASIVYGSLIYKEVDSEQQANIGIEIRIVDMSESKENRSPVETKQYSYTFSQDDTNIINSQDSFDFQEQIEVSPGSYKIYFTVTDQHSGKTIARTATSSIPDPNNNELALTEIRMLGKDMDASSPEWIPINTYDVTSAIDSLRFIFQVTNNKSEEPLSISSELVRFRSDSSIARPMHFNNYSPSSITYKGVDYSEETIIQERQRQLLQEGSVLIEFRFAKQPRGNYRFRVQSDKEETQLFKARDFGVKSKNYPALKTARELARPLAYLMNDKEHDALMSISNSDSLKKEIDRFWLKNIGNQNKAVNVLKMYYERVEAANKQFSSFKEGWKTDTGMIYILFGPPWQVEKSETNAMGLHLQ
ncbi:MAG: GWxTD domain-containing protein [Balneolaceae bacterium]|nr:GWxTD domain-containing protein [Balneolaceae bacterium]